MEDAEDAMRFVSDILYRRDSVPVHCFLEVQGALISVGFIIIFT
jgi:hypothetical protein